MNAELIAEPAVEQAATPKAPMRLSDQYGRRPDVRQRYDAAQTNPENARHWANADCLGPDAALDPTVRAKLRNRARYEVANDTYANGMVTTLANDTIGTGPSLQVLGLPKESAKKVERAWWLWTVAVRFPVLLRTMRRAKCVDGEFFGTFFTNPQLRDPQNRAKRFPVTLDIQLHEAEMIASPALGMMNQSLSDGIIFDDFGNVVAYIILTDHPGERSGVAPTWETVPAKDVMHGFNADRPDQTRGAPEITPALPLFALRRRYSLAVLRAAEVAALISGVIQTQTNPADPDELEPLDAIDMERGQFITLPKGWVANQLKAEQPTTMFDQFTKSIIREAGRCIGMPLNIAAADSSGYNYSSGRMDDQIYKSSLAVERSYLELTACDPAFVRWFEEARLIPDYLPEDARALTEPPDRMWRWTGRGHVDPLKESKSTTENIANGTTHRAAEYSKQGKDIDDEDEIAARTFGLTVEEYRRMLAQKLLGGATQQQPQAVDDTGLPIEVADE